MDDTHATTNHGGTGAMPYLVIFGALVIFTAVSFIVNGAVRGGSVAAPTGFTIILAVAVCKALLVAIFFMHLKFDWKRVYFMIVPVLILGTMMLIVFLPDMVLAWPH